MAADLKALIAEHEASAPLHVPAVSMVIDSAESQRSFLDGQARSESKAGFKAEPHLDEAEGSKAPQPTLYAESEQKPAQASHHPDSKQTIHSSVMQPGHSSADIKAPENATIGSGAASKPSGNAQLAVAADKVGSSGAAPGKGMRPSMMQVSSAQAPQATAVAAPEAGSQQSSFLGKALSNGAVKGSFGKETLSTSQAQQIADAAAAGTPLQHNLGAKANGTAPASAKAAAVPSSSKGLTPSALQPPKTSEHWPHQQCMMHIV